MKKILMTAIALVFAHTAHAAPAAKLAPMQVLQAAVSCDLPQGKYKDVVKAIKTLKLKPKADSNFYPVQLSVWGREVIGIAIDDLDVESYGAVFKDTSVKELAAAAGMAAGVDGKQGKHGSLLVAERNHETWSLCTAGNAM